MKLALLDSRRNIPLAPLAAILMFREQFTLLPEVHTAFGDEGTLKFLDMFAGMTLKVPTHDELSRSIRDVTIWAELKRDMNKIAKMVEEYGLTPERVRKIFREVDHQMDQLKITPVAAHGEG